MLACLVAWYKREFLALPVTAAGMTAMQVTAGLGTLRARLHWGRRAADTLSDSLPKSPLPHWALTLLWPGKQTGSMLGLLCPGAGRDQCSLPVSQW